MAQEKFDLLFEIIDNMKVKELAEFIHLFEERYNISYARLQTPEPIVAEDTKTTNDDDHTEWAVYLLEVPTGTNRINLIKEIRATFNRGLAESKAIVDSTPIMLTQFVTLDVAESIAQKLEAWGAKVELRGQ